MTESNQEEAGGVAGATKEKRLTADELAVVAEDTVNKIMAKNAENLIPVKVQFPEGKFQLSGDFAP